MKTQAQPYRETSLQTFNQAFPSEEACVDFLCNLRWPLGFVCPFCHGRHPDIPTQRSMLCPRCGNRSSVTAGTILHGAKKPLRDWLLAIWWFSGTQFDSSAKELQRLLAISCYQTAWTWLQKLRFAMGRADRGRCRGVVEIGCNTIAPARERKERALVLTAAEVVVSLGITGRIRMRHICAMDQPTLLQFVHESVQAASSILAPEDPYYDGLAGSTSFYVDRFPSTSPQRIEDINHSFATCLHCVHRGGVTVKHLQGYLDEFCFRSNAALLPDHEAIFRALLAGIFSETAGSCDHPATAGTCP